MLEVKMLTAFHIVFGQYFKISSSKAMSCSIRLYCLALSVFATYNRISSGISLFQYDIKRFCCVVMFTVEFSLWYLLSQINTQTYLSKYIQAIENCDRYMGYPRRVLEMKYVFIFIVFHITLSLISLLSDMLLSRFWANRFHADTYSVVLLLSQWFVAQSLMLASLRIVVAVGLLQSRLMMLQEALENSLDAIDTNRDVIFTKLRTIKKCMLNYQNLLNAYDDIQWHMHFNMFIILFFSVPELTTFGYAVIKQIIFSDTSRIMFVDTLRYFVKISAPCVFCELCRNETDRLKMLLMKQFVRSAEREVRAELQRALEYVTRRQFSFTLLRAARVDINLPVTIIAFAFTYILLMIEFSHFVL